MIESVTDHAMVMIGPDGTILVVEPRGRTAFRLHGGRGSRSNISMFAPDGNRWREDETADLAFAIEHGPAEGEGWRLRKDGSRFWAHFVTTPVRDEQGQLVGLARVTRDLTRAS